MWKSGSRCQPMWLKLMYTFCFIFTFHFLHLNWWLSWPFLCLVKPRPSVLYIIVLQTKLSNFKRLGFKDRALILPIQCWLWSNQIEKKWSLVWYPVFCNAYTQNIKYWSRPSVDCQNQQPNTVTLTHGHQPVAECYLKAPQWLAHWCHFQCWLHSQRKMVDNYEIDCCQWDFLLNKAWFSAKCYRDIQCVCSASPN